MTGAVVMGCCTDCGGEDAVAAEVVAVAAGAAIKEEDVDEEEEGAGDVVMIARKGTSNCRQQVWMSEPRNVRGSTKDSLLR